jgi:hypothetical protein
MDPLTTALCVSALTEDLRFLTPVLNRMAKLLGSQLTACQLTDKNSQVTARLALKQATQGFVLIFTHGAADYLRGGEYRDRTGEIVEVEKFITRDDLSVFNGKVVFCMSCDSNGLAQDCLAEGATAFIGFDEIPFDRFDADGKSIGGHTLQKHCQKLLADAVKETLVRFFTGRASLDEAVDYLRLWISKNAVAYVRKNTSVKERREVAALLLKVKDGIRYHGPSGISFKICARGR